MLKVSHKKSGHNRFYLAILLYHLCMSVALWYTCKRTYTCRQNFLTCIFLSENVEILSVHKNRTEISYNWITVSAAMHHKSHFTLGRVWDFVTRDFTTFELLLQLSCKQQLWLSGWATHLRPAWVIGGGREGIEPTLLPVKCYLSQRLSNGVNDVDVLHLIVLFDLLSCFRFLL